MRYSQLNAFVYDSTEVQLNLWWVREKERDRERALAAEVRGRAVLDGRGTPSEGGREERVERTS